MRIKHFKPDHEQLPTSLWFMADRYPVMYEMIDNMTVQYHFIFYKAMPWEQILKEANKVFCRQPQKYGNPKWKVKTITELQSEDETEKVVRVEFEFGSL